MEENMQHFWCIMLDYFKKSKNVTETQKKISAPYGKGVVTDRMYQKWFAKYLGTIDIMTKKFFLWGCLMHWKIFSSTPGLHPLEANSRR